MKKPNDEISAQENNNESRKRDEEDESEHENDQSNPHKRARISVSIASLPPEPEPEHGHALELPACFNSLDDDCLGNVLDFVGKKCYSVFGRVNKRCHEMFCSKGLPKETYLYGYAPLRFIQQQRGRWIYNKKISKGVLQFNRRDILDWILADETRDGYNRLQWLCWKAIEESRLDILREVFDRADESQLEILRECYNDINLCTIAAEYGKLDCLKFLRENECGWTGATWYYARRKGHGHILEYLRDNGYPTEWR